MTKKDVLDYLKTHKQELFQKYGVVSIGLFGSFSKDIQTSDSDIDIAVEIQKDKKTLSNFFGLRRELESAFHRRVDLGIESSLKPVVREYIKKDIVYV